MEFVFRGNRREGEHLPIAEFQDMPDQVVLMKALHRDNNAPDGLIIKAAVRRVGEPIIRVFAADLR
jgi:hypothetical protein